MNVALWLGTHIYPGSFEWTREAAVPEYGKRYLRPQNRTESF
jgi:hypothetical protein